MSDLLHFALAIGAAVYSFAWFELLRLAALVRRLEQL
jgi:hypothetical protein